MDIQDEGRLPSVLMGYIGYRTKTMVQRLYDRLITQVGEAPHTLSYQHFKALCDGGY